MKLQVNKKLNGTIIIPTVTKVGMQPGAEFDVSEEQYWKPDVQRALKNKDIRVISGKAPQAPKEVQIINIGKGSISLPIKGIMLPGQIIYIDASELETTGYVRLLRDKLIARLDKLSKKALYQIIKDSQKEEEELDLLDIEESKPLTGKKKTEKKLDKPIVWRPKSDLHEAKPLGKKKHAIRKLHSSDSDDAAIENGMEPGEKDGIQFVDIEQAEQRISSHPVLRKRNK